MATPVALRDGRYADTPIEYPGDYHPAADSTALLSATASTKAIFDKYATIPANTLKAGSRIIIRWKVARLLQRLTDTQANELTIGPTPWVDGTDVVIVNSPAADKAADCVFIGRSVLTVKVDGASGSFDAVSMYHALDTVGSAIISGEVDAGSLNTTIDNIIAMTCLFSDGTVGNSAVLEMFSVQVLPPTY